MPCRVKDDHRTGINEPVDRRGSGRAVTPLSPCARTTAYACPVGLRGHARYGQHCHCR